MVGVIPLNDIIKSRDPSKIVKFWGYPSIDSSLADNN